MLICLKEAKEFKKESQMGSGGRLWQEVYSLLFQHSCDFSGLCLTDCHYEKVAKVKIWLADGLLNSSIQNALNIALHVSMKSVFLLTSVPAEVDGRKSMVYGRQTVAFCVQKARCFQSKEIHLMTFAMESQTV